MTDPAYPDTDHSGAAASILIGCAGWNIPAPSAGAFPGDGSHLERYAQVMPAVEINSSFYRPHQPKTYARWADSVPASFRFSAKLPRTITHEKRLRDCDALLEKFLFEVSHLGDKLGCLLVQLPPSLAFDEPVADAFFAQLIARTSVPLACEARHASWFAPSAADCMRRHGVACVFADPNPVPGAIPSGAAGLVYLRLHGSPQMYRSAYTPQFLQSINTCIRADAMEGRARAVWCIFDNTAAGAASDDALKLMALLGLRKAVQASEG